MTTIESIITAVAAPGVSFEIDDAQLAAVSFLADHLGGGPHGLEVALLACDCGEPGCWDFVAAVKVNEDTVLWSEFAQVHRPQWDYGGFGPFEFDRMEYEAALRGAWRSFTAASRLSESSASLSQHSNARGPARRLPPNAGLVT
jgi:hypothetical protein